MATYAMSDIHGCYSEFLRMLVLIDFKDEDELILLGDYIDRGPDNAFALSYITNIEENVHVLKGNHEEEFCGCVGIIKAICDLKNKPYYSLNATKESYEAAKKSFDPTNSFFDVYGTVHELIYDRSYNLERLLNIQEVVDRFPYYYEKQINNKRHIFVHAGYIENYDSVSDKFDTFEKACLYARKEGYLFGGVENGVVIAGHTPTNLIEEFCYNKGNVFYYLNEDINCEFYNIDCGCSINEDTSKLACIRLEDREIFYINTN